MTPHTLPLDLAGAEADVVAFDVGVAQDDPRSLEKAPDRHDALLRHSIQAHGVRVFNSLYPLEDGVFPPFAGRRRLD